MLYISFVFYFISYSSCVSPFNSYDCPVRPTTECPRPGLTEAASHPPLAPSPQVVQSLKRPLSSPVIATGIKRPSIIQTIQAPLAPAKVASTKLLSFTVDPNKTAKQLSLLRHSYTQCPFPEEDEVSDHSRYDNNDTPSRHFFGF